MSDAKRTASLHHRNEPREAWAPPEPGTRLPRRFAAAQWFGDASVAPQCVRPPLWQLAQPRAWRFLAGMRGRLVWMTRFSCH